MADEVLVVASKVKGYIKEKGDMKTSASVLTALSDKIRQMCDQEHEPICTGYLSTAVSFVT